MPVVTLPPQIEFCTKVGKNKVALLRQAQRNEDVQISGITDGRARGVALTHQDGRRTIVFPKPYQHARATDQVLILNGVTAEIFEADTLQSLRARWHAPATVPESQLTPDYLQRRKRETRASWVGCFNFRAEVRDSEGELAASGLRRSQVGAIHAALAHWTVSDEPATVVMPTGAGKTEVMLSLLLASQPASLLVMVPSDALRQQTVSKFLGLGRLRDLGVLEGTVKNPIVGTLAHAPRTAEEVDRLFGICNVIICTAAAIARCSRDVQSRIAEHVTHFFIDEAHHVAASTWQAFRGLLKGARVLQFTATPFRRDRQPVSGRPIYSYPLRFAQQDGYFRPIRFRPIVVYDSGAADRAVANESLSALRADLAAGLDHLLMARVDQIRKVERVLELYRELAPDLAPVAVHTKMRAAERKASLTELSLRRSRIVVCVDMLGEGFDLPNLKIAALHDVHASLAVTLQFIGRFTRSAAAGVGYATAVANIADPMVEKALLELYAEDADWNTLLQILSEGATRRYRQDAEMLRGFSDPPVGIPLQAVQPKMSAVVYRTQCDEWNPHGLLASIGSGDRANVWLTVNDEQKVAVLVVREESPAPWTAGRSPVDVSWRLYLLYWSDAQRLLFINCSTDVGLPDWVAQAVTDGHATVVQGEAVFRALHGISHLTMMNLGLKHALNRGARFTMYVGDNILQGIEDARLLNSSKTNLFARGYQHGYRSSLGCSLKGRIWSYRIAHSLSEWRAWCSGVGTRLIDEAIDPQEVVRRVLVPKIVAERPPLVPIAVEWPDELLLHNHDVLRIRIAGAELPMLDCDLKLLHHETTRPLAFRVQVGPAQVAYEVGFQGDRVVYHCLDNSRAELVFSRRSRDLGEWFQENPPVIRFAENSFLDGNRFFHVSQEGRDSFERERIDAWDWAGTDIRRESQRAERDPASIQFAVIEALKNGRLGGPFDLVIDDDGSGEIADVVAARYGEDQVDLLFVHCKYSSGAQPGARIGDLYEVCGQATKSVVWKGRPERMCSSLGARAAAKQARTGVSAIEVGTPGSIPTLRRRLAGADVKLTVAIVQPGMSRAQATGAQLDLLAATASFLKTTYAAEFCVIASG